MNKTFIFNNARIKTTELENDIWSGCVKCTYEIEAYPDANGYRVLVMDEPMYNRYFAPQITKVLFNEPYTITFFDDGTKTIVKCQEGDIYDKEKGLAMCILKKVYGGSCYFDDIKNWAEQ